MRRVAGLLLAVVAVGLGGESSAGRDDKEDKAKAADAAAAFLKAIRAKDLDAAVALAAVPFHYEDAKGKPLVHKTEEGLKKWLKSRMDSLKEKDLEQFPDRVGGAVPFSVMKPKMVNEQQKAAVEAVVGEDGFVVIAVGGKKERGAVLVKIIDGKAKVVGLAG